MRVIQDLTDCQGALVWLHFPCYTSTCPKVFFTGLYQIALIYIKKKVRAKAVQDGAGQGGPVILIMVRHKSANVNIMSKAKEYSVSS